MEPIARGAKDSNGDSATAIWPDWDRECVRLTVGAVRSHTRALIGRPVIGHLAARTQRVAVNPE